MNSTLRALGVKLAQAPFTHGGASSVGDITVFSSYHCSRYNTNTNRLTPQMFENVVAAIAAQLGGITHAR